MSKLLRIASVITLVFMGALAVVQFTSASWPTTVAVIQQAGWDAELNLTHRGSSDYHVSYKYEVGGKFYESSMVGFGSGPTVIHIINTREDRQPREDDQVTAYYAPFYPGFSVLQPGVASNLWIWGLGAVLISVMLWMVGGVLHEPVI